jgi:hypothetical protein
MGIGTGTGRSIEKEVEPEREGTRLRVVQSGFRGVRGWMVSVMLARGWAKMLVGSLLREIEGNASAGRATGTP